MNWKAEEMLNMHAPRVLSMMRAQRSGSVRSMLMRTPGMHGLGVLDPGLTTASVLGNALGWASLPALIGAVLYGVKKKSAARTFFVIAGIAGGVGAAAGVLAAQKLDETMSVGL